MRIATWNVNSLRARLPRVCAWLEANQPDVLCAQEIKAEDAACPRSEIEALRYCVSLHGQRTYNGVAIFSREEPRDVERGFPDDPPDAQRRLIAATVGDVRVVNVYVPNGQRVASDKFAFKLEWMEKLRRFLDERCDPNQPLLLCGDFNVAPEDRDVHDPAFWRGETLYHPDAVAALKRITDWGLVDALRLHTQEPGLYSWWDYRMGAFHRGFGLRIDLILLTKALAARCRAVTIDREARKGPQPSDHAPVVAELD